MYSFKTANKVPISDCCGPHHHTTYPLIENMSTSQMLSPHICIVPLIRDGANVIDAIKCNRNVTDCKVHVIVRIIDWKVKVIEM